MLNPKTFCILPFTRAVVRADGSVGPCCYNNTVGNIRKENLLEYWNGTKLQEIKADILNGKPYIQGCDGCYAHEEFLGTSMRIDSLNNNNFFSEKYYLKIFEHKKLNQLSFPNDIEMHVGNQCNLKCLTCKPQDSSKFLAENKILKISNDKQSDFVFENNILSTNLDLAFNYANQIDLRGGESMLMPTIKNFLKKADHHKCQDKSLRLQTNGTVFDDEWAEIFKKFKSLEIMVSVDATGKAFEYIRYPGKWDVVVYNINQFKTVECKLYINCTISNLNIIILNQLLEWSSRHNVHTHLTTAIEPEYYNVRNLPQKLIDQAEQHLNPWFNQYPLLKTMFQNLKSDTTQWKIFCEMINKRDKYRKNSIFDIIPQFKEYWNAQN